MRRVVTALYLMTLCNVAVAESLDPIVSAMPTLRREATVSGELVRIGDLIENAGAAAGTAIFRAPDLGETGAVEAFRIIDAVRPYGLIGVDSQGIGKVVVIRPGRIITTRDIEAAIAHAIAERYGLGDFKNLAFTFDHEVRPIHLAQTVAAQMQPIRIGYDRASGRFDLSFEIPGSPAMPAPTLRFAGSVVETRNVAVLLRSLGRGDVVKKTDVTMERRPLAELGDAAVEDGDSVIGLAARQPLRAGQPLHAVDLAKPMVVQRGDPVTIVYEVPGVLLTIRGKALDSGAQGDLISVVNGQSKRPIQVTVTGPGRVAVAANSVEQAAVSVSSEPRGTQGRRTE
jgi:flagella basal body P-ring formation protein FlgA